MRKIIVTEFMSLDGVIENPAWSMPYWSDEIADFKREEDAMTDALLLGRVTYEGFAAAWPNSKDEGAERINGMPKYVASNTLERADWNNSSIISGDTIAGIKALQAQPGQDLLVYGSGVLVRSLMAHDLVDSYRLLVYPVLVGGGQRLFEGAPPRNLKLQESRTLGSGVLALVYVPERG